MPSRRLLFFTTLIVACTHQPIQNDLKRTMASDMVHNVLSTKQIREQCQKAGFVNRITGAQQQVINEVMAKPEHRMQHALWHTVRSGLTPDEIRKVTRAYGREWNKASVLCPAPGANSDSTRYNSVGEDFLYMHRSMIEMLQQEFLARDMKCLRAWDSMEQARTWPVPNASPSDSVKSASAMKKFIDWDKVFQDTEKWLPSISLSQLGWAVEFSIHNNLHMRFATNNPPTGFEEAAEVGGAPISFDKPIASDWKFNDPKYNWLADPFGAAVNPTFWKIHGYVDHLIDKWLEAHEFNEIAANCGRRTKCYEWKGNWVGTSISPDIFVPAPDVKDRALGARPSPEEDSINLKKMRSFTIGKLENSRDLPPKVGAPRVKFDPIEYVNQVLCREQ